MASHAFALPSRRTRRRIVQSTSPPYASSPQRPEPQGVAMAMAPLEVQVKDLPASSGAKPGAPTVLVNVIGEALVDLEPMVTTLQSVADRHPAKVILDLHDLSFISSLA